MNNIRVVLIEDHDLTRMGLRAGLQNQDSIQVLGEAANASQGLRMLETHRPDVAIVDIGLPDMDGIELTRKIRKLQSEHKLPAEGEESPMRVLILTMHDSEDAVLAAFAAGADSYCMKDINFSRLAEAIRATQDGQSWVDPAIANIVLRQVRQAPSEDGGSKTKTVAIGAVDSEYEKLLESSPLTERELEVLELIVAGYSNASISEKLYITVGTVKTHVRNILNKLSVDDRTQAAVRALRAGLIG
ncbi:MAG: response regulator transcription factor [Oculatellaceae cyanobacterium Prado106]|jgi:DNA-binding NarL/FixJ family response regulator|nr:response regulator transcription factor [Oculatellaceae cyanobacterium Prado106]